MMFKTYNCPCCDSKDTAYLDAPDIYDDEVYVAVLCNECGTSWTKHFYYEGSDLIKKGEKMGATYEFEHEIGKKVWVMLNNIPTEVTIFGHVLTATLHTYKDGLCEYTVKTDRHNSVEQKMKSEKIFNTKEDLVRSL